MVGAWAVGRNLTGVAQRSIRVGRQRRIEFNRRQGRAPDRVWSAAQRIRSRHPQAADLMVTGEGGLLDRVSERRVHVRALVFRGQVRLPVDPELQDQPVRERHLDDVVRAARMATGPDDARRFGAGLGLEQEQRRQAARHLALCLERCARRDAGG